MKENIRRAAALFLAASLFLTGCRSNTVATTMELNKTEGTGNLQADLRPVRHLS